MLEMSETTHHPSDHPSNDFPGSCTNILSRPKPALVKSPEIRFQYKMRHVLCKMCLLEYSFLVCCSTPLKKTLKKVTPFTMFGIYVRFLVCFQGPQRPRDDLSCALGPWT